MIDWPEELVHDIARRRSVIFIGAGVSRNSVNDHGERPADWKEFLTGLAATVRDQICRDAVLSCIQAGDLLTACEIAYKALRPDVFRTKLLEAFSQKRFRPAKIHEDLIRIDSRLVMTTNFDKIYDSLAATELQGDVLVKTYADEDVAEIIRRTNRCILKIHGTIDTPSGAILTRSDYARLRNKHANFYKVVDALFVTHTFLFLGASMNDPDIRLLLEDHANRYVASRPHFIVMPQGQISEPELAVLEESMNLIAIQYSPAENHQELAESVDHLRDLVDIEREALTESADW